MESNQIEAREEDLVGNDPVKIVMMSHLSDVQARIVIHASGVDHLNFVKFLIDKYVSRDLWVDADADYEEFTRLMERVQKRNQA